ncbi:MAG TPA: hypothetical protein DF774_06005 [Rheinheimera sp.]|nr:hypothetical protein [Rheinheimera sp.]
MVGAAGNNHKAVSVTGCCKRQASVLLVYSFGRQAVCGLPPGQGQGRCCHFLYFSVNSLSWRYCGGNSWFAVLPDTCNKGLDLTMMASFSLT